MHLLVDSIDLSNRQSANTHICMLCTLPKSNHTGCWIRIIDNAELIQNTQ